ncbi:Transposase DDE domain protein [Streptomyces lavendulae subsp. lavendulae]|uniref:Transposase DDE domain protein n=1 Tax=Streptomyces lavendulae subsp. lavendulae TaxID=58340 RepID=A0A2K8PSF2_STRLA|nr:Transposase DDE domain protein [Streptomyces lavendulae subsp. lavendulae]
MLVRCWLRCVERAPYAAKAAQTKPQESGCRVVSPGCFVPSCRHRVTDEVVESERNALPEISAAGTPSPVDRRKTGSKHHLICDGRGTPLKVITTAANVNDVTQTLALVDGLPPVAGRPGRRPEALLGDKGYDSNPNRDELRKRRILPVISRKGAPNIKDMGKLRYFVEQTSALLHQLKRLAVRWERRTELHDALVSLACSLICWRRLNKPEP